MKVASEGEMKSPFVKRSGQYSWTAISTVDCKEKVDDRNGYRRDCNFQRGMLALIQLSCGD